MSVEATRTICPPLADSLSERRRALFRETPWETLERCVLGTAWALQPKRIGALPQLAQVWFSDLLSPSSGLPPAEGPMRSPSGLCGIARALSAETLIEAYRRGLFALAHCGPLKWYSPPERCVLFFDEFHISKRLRREMRRGEFRVTFDRDFEQVIKHCAGRRRGKWHVTWITPRVMQLFAELFDAGWVHSFEVWNQHGALVGGGYGVAIGRVFFTESQFSLESDTSKIGFSVLNWHLAKWGFVLNDGKRPAATLLDMGFRNISRASFVNHLAESAGPQASPGPWKTETDLPTVAAWRPGADARGGGEGSVPRIEAPPLTAALPSGGGGKRLLPAHEQRDEKAVRPGSPRGHEHSVT